MVDSLTVSRRDETQSGTKRCRRLRAAGQIPAVLYGHGEPSVSLAVPGDAFQSVLRHHGHVVTLAGDVETDALIKAVQYDTFGQRVLHVDLVRVARGESVEVTLSLETTGEAPGVREGGILQLTAHELTILCPPLAIPESLTISVADLQMGQTLTAGDVPLPQGASLVGDAERMIAHIVRPVAEPEPVEDEPTAEPERIGEKGTDEDEES